MLGTATDSDHHPCSGFDIRLVGQRNTLAINVCREGDSLDGDIVCDMTISRVPGRGAPCPPMSFQVSAPTHEGISQQAIGRVISEGYKIRNLTRFRYDVESSVREVDQAIRTLDETMRQSPRDAVLSISTKQVEQMMDELPLVADTHVERMMIDTFKAAVRNVIGAAYDAGHRDGTEEVGKKSHRDLFDYEGALDEMDLMSLL